LPVAAVAMGIFLALPPAFGDDMSKDRMSKSSTMSKDSMSKHKMSKDQMNKDTMSKEGMKKDNMSKDIKMVENSRHPAKRIARRPPTFEARQLKSSSRWYVRVLWQYGQEQHVRGFVSASEAESWISKTSEGWLRNRTAALRGI
jgi:pentapeptide MXKDX repeat protein